MPRKKEISNILNLDLISLQVYKNNHFSAFSLHDEFEKWACVEVSHFAKIPQGMEALTLQDGLYAVFKYTGSSNDPRIFEYIYGTWIPDSGYILHHRPHFEVLGNKYKNNDPHSEEEIWIPIQPKPVQS